MAAKALIVDNLDGSGGASTVSFSLGNTAYEIDLLKKNKAAMERSCPSSLPPPATSRGPGCWQE